MAALMLPGEDSNQQLRTNEPNVFGYDKNIFLAKLDDKFLCHFCNLGLKDPRQTCCGHRFCHMCLQHMLHEKIKICPGCQKEDCVEESSELALKNSFRDKAICRELDRLDSKCLNSGCKWTATFKEYLEHQETCELNPTPCDKCHQMIQKNYLEHHNTAECPCRLVICQYCNEEFVYDDLDMHKQICNKRPCKCDRCGENVPFDKLTTHKHPERGTCPIVECQFGCKELIERQRIPEHNKQVSDVHTAFLFTELQKQRNLYRHDISQIQARLKNFEDRISVIQSHQPMKKQERAERGATAKEDISLQMNRIETKLVNLERMIGINSNIVDVIKDESARNADSLNSQLREEEKTKEEMENHIRALQRKVGIQNMAIKELNEKVELMHNNSFDGTLVWKITNFSEKLADAESGNVPCILSPPFWTSRQGYKMRVRLYLNGDGPAKGTFISVFFQLMRGEFDAVLAWPFSNKQVQFSIIDQNEREKEHHRDIFNPDSSHPSCLRPRSDANQSVGCPELMALGRLRERSRKYVVDNTMFIKVVVKQR